MKKLQTKLREIEKRYPDVFNSENGLSILNCVSIVSQKPVSVHILNPNIPSEIKWEIDEILWIN